MIQEQSLQVHEMGRANVQASLGARHVRMPGPPPRLMAPGEEPPSLNKFSVAEFAAAIEDREEVKTHG